MKKTDKTIYYLSTITTWVNKYSWLCSLIGYIVINFLFMYTFWHQLVFDMSIIGAVYGEVQATEYAMDVVYRNLIHFQNPFLSFTHLLYPFQLDIVGSDPGFAFNLIFFRPFLSLHQSVSMVVVTSLFAANIGMYLFLRKMKIDKLVAFIISLAYGFMTFLTPRMGHLNYMVIYLFPWFYLFLYTFFITSKKKMKYASMLATVFFFVLALWQNMYYFIMLALSLGILGVYYIWKLRWKAIRSINKNMQYIIVAIIFFIILLYPWLQALYKTMLFSETPSPQGWGGAIDYSADLLTIFVPNQHNYYYGRFIPVLTKNIEFAQSLFERFTYPGAIIFLVYIVIIFRYKKLSHKLKKRIQPFFLTSIAFFILTLGPFLHIAGRWWIQLEEGIRLVFPLPFVILHYVPFIGNIRAPGRFSVGMIFFAYIVVAYLLSYWLRNKSQKMRIALFLLLFFIFIIDHRYPAKEVASPRYIPVSIYNKIAQDSAFVSVLRIPFVIRDGFTYFGDYNTILINEGQDIYKKPVIGGYSGRIANYIKIYYQHDPFIGYMGRMIDANADINGGIDNSTNQDWSIFGTEESKKTLDFLSIKYIIIDDSFEGMDEIVSILGQVGYKKIKTDKQYSLWARDVGSQEFLQFDVSQTNYRRYLAMGWYPREKDFVWSARRSSVLFKVNKLRDMDLTFNVEAFYKSRLMTVYVNKEKISTLDISTEMKKYIVNIPQEYLVKGVNHIYFIFNKGYIPAKVIEGSLDGRKLGGKFSTINLQDKK